MPKDTAKDRITLFSVIDSFGEQGGTLRQIQYDFQQVTGASLDRRQFIRSKKDIENLFGVKINCLRAGAESRYFVDKSGTEEQKKDSIRMCCMNSFLLNNSFTDNRLSNNRVHIADSYNNVHAKVVAQALAQRREIHIKASSREFDFIPYALAYFECWYMFGKKPGDGELLVFSLNDVRDSKFGQDFGDAPDNFDLKNVLANIYTVFPMDKLNVDDRMSLWMSLTNTGIATINNI